MTNFNIAQTLAEVSDRIPERTGLICKSFPGSRCWTFRELNETADAYANGLAGQGVKKGDRVVLMVRPSLDFVCLTFALFKIGAVVILIDPGMGYKNLLKCIGSVKPAVFIGVFMAHLFKRLFPVPFKTVKTNICAGTCPPFFGTSLAKIADYSKGAFPAIAAEKDDLAAIIFTTGSTGPPKGVQYEHSIFQAQLELIREYYGIRPGDVDQPAFPLFALFSTALGACAVIPDMNPAHPARVNPAKFVSSILKHRVTYSFGSPAIWNVVSRYCLENKITLPSLKKILMAGAPVSGELIKRVKAILPSDAEIHTPYGATESLPIASMSGTEILAETWDRTRKGKGTCVGRPLPGIDIRIIPISDAPVPQWHENLPLSEGEIGEIVVKGPVVTKAYDHNDPENRHAKISDQHGFWHRVGDVGYFDEQGRLWFCGRKAHRVVTGQGTMFTIPCEAIFNEHPAVFRSALVGVGPENAQTPVLIVELHKAAKKPDSDGLMNELRQMAQQHPLTASIRKFLFHPSFPVDIRHNAKIFREKLAIWAAGELRKSSRG